MDKQTKYKTLEVTTNANLRVGAQNSDNARGQRFFARVPRELTRLFSNRLAREIGFEKIEGESMTYDVHLGGFGNNSKKYLPARIDSAKIPEAARGFVVTTPRAEAYAAGRTPRPKITVDFYKKR